MKSPYDVRGMKRLAYPYQVVMGETQIHVQCNPRLRGCENNTSKAAATPMVWVRLLKPLLLL